MGDSVHEHMVRELDWLSRFDVLVWSYQLGVAKPERAIYRYALERLGTRPEETLFIDDKAENVDAATAMGMKGMIFSTVEKLREELRKSGPGWRVAAAVRRSASMSGDFALAVQMVGEAHGGIHHVEAGIDGNDEGVGKMIIAKETQAQIEAFVDTDFEPNGRL